MASKKDLKSKTKTLGKKLANLPSKKKMRKAKNYFKKVRQKHRMEQEIMRLRLQIYGDTTTND